MEAPPPIDQSFRHELLDGMMSALALKPIPAKKLLKLLKATLIPPAA